MTSFILCNVPCVSLSVMVCFDLTAGVVSIIGPYLGSSMWFEFLSVISLACFGARASTVCNVQELNTLEKRRPRILPKFVRHGTSEPSPYIGWKV